MRRMHFHFRIRGLCMEVFKSYFKLAIDVIPIAVQIYTICNQLSTGPMVNLLQIVSPKKGWCPGFPLNKSSVSWSLGRNFLYLLFLLTNISVRIVSEKPSVNIQLRKSFSTLSHPPLLFFAVLFSLFLSFPPSLSFFFFLNTLYFSLPAQILILYFLHEGLGKNWRGENTPYRCRQNMEFNKTFFKSILHQFIRNQHQTYSSFFPTEREENYHFIKFENYLEYNNLGPCHYGKLYLLLWKYWLKTLFYYVASLFLCSEFKTEFSSYWRQWQSVLSVCFCFLIRGGMFLLCINVNCLLHYFNACCFHTSKEAPNSSSQRIFSVTMFFMF